jgi:two-component system chemotaxis response regulator CheB
MGHGELRAGRPAGAGEVAVREGVRALQEREILLRRVAAVAHATGEPAQAEAALREADTLHGQVRDLRRLASAVGTHDG